MRAGGCLEISSQLRVAQNSIVLKLSWRSNNAGDTSTEYCCIIE